MSQNPETFSLYRQLREARLTGSHAQVLRILREIVAKDPQDKEAAAQLVAASPPSGAGKDEAGRNPETDTLYRQLRGAKLTGDHAQAVCMLQQIVARDPQDKEAASQLAEYARHAPKTTCEEDARTRALFQKLRAACLTQNDPEAFRILKQILDITPQNVQARQQKKEIGERLSAIYAEDLDRLLLAGDETAIYNRVTQLREYADDDYLGRYDSFAAAASIADGVHARIMRGKLDGMMEKLKATKSLDERREKALAMTRFASENQVSLSQVEKALINEIEETWKTEQYRLQLLQAVSETSAQLAQAISAFGNASPADTILLMEKIRNRAVELTEIPEGEELLKRVEVAFQKMCSAYKAAEARRRAAHCVWAILLFLVVAFVSITAYAASTVKEKTASLAAYRAAKNPVGIQKELKVNSFLVVFYKNMNAGYATEYDACRNYLREWQREMVGLNRLIAQIKACEGKVTSENILQVAELFANVIDASERLENQFGYKMAERRKAELQKVISEMQEQMGVILQSYLKPMNYAYLSEAAARLQSFLNTKQALSYEKEDVDAVVNQFRQDIARSFNDICFRSPERVGEWLTDYDATLAPYENVLLLREGFNRQAQGMAELYALPGKLANCKTLEAYTEQLSKSAPLLEGVAGMEETDELTAWAQKADLYAQQEKLKSTLAGSKASHLYHEDSLDSLKLLQKVYRQGESLFPGSRPSALNATIDQMTQSSPHWPKELDQVEYNGQMYVGRVYQVNNEKRLLVEGSKEKLILPRGTRVRALHMAEARVRAGMKRMNLQCGLVTPTALMVNIANLPDKEIPALAKAYLFSLAVEMMDKLGDPLLSGIHFSPSLAADVEQFKKLSAQSQLFDGCWMKPYSAGIEKKWIAFFRNLDGKTRYAKEIEKNIGKILSARCAYVGYFGQNGQPVFINAVDRDTPLYIPGRESLRPWSSGAERPFTPIFTIQ